MSAQLLTILAHNEKW